MIRLTRALVVLTGIGSGILCFAQENGSAQIKVVKGVPFSAQVVTESTQVLGDGNHIVHTSTVLLARDSEGRTRREQSFSGISNSSNESPAAAVVFIQDPVSATSFIVDKRSHSALKIVTPQVKAVESVDPIAGKAGDGNALQIKTESLGTQIIEGVEAEGTRITRMISAHEAGNEQPIKVVSEIWHSSAIETVVMSRSIDPRVGETVFKLKDIQRAEPDHSLFEVPTGYTMLESQNSKR